MYGGMTHDDLMMRKARSVCFVQDILSDGHVTGTLVAMPSHRSHSQGQEVVLECVAMVQGRFQQDVPLLEDTATPVEVQIETVSVEDGLQVLP